MMPRPNNLIHTDDINWTDHTRNGKVLFRRKALGQTAGGNKLGTSLYEVPPGERLWTYHYHCANEEALCVLEGEGTVRLPDGEHPIGPGDFLAFKVGPKGAHVVQAGPGSSLRVLIVSTMIEPEVNGYPDSDKVAVFAGSPPGADRSLRTLDLYLRTDDPVDYWYGEE
ncbi:MAG: cupin domain-containing protein [Fidelibacterota bacterium]|nr:MAG: cupin domain-containing protein [Candidatus Neomarinimicrobiota bacterium]